MIRFSCKHGQRVSRSRAALTCKHISKRERDSRRPSKKKKKSIASRKRKRQPPDNEKLSSSSSRYTSQHPNSHPSAHVCSSRSISLSGTIRSAAADFPENASGGRMDDHRKVRMEPPTSVIARLSPQNNNRRAIYGILSLRIQSKMKGYGVSRGSRSFSNNNNNNNDIVALYAALILALIVVCSKAVRM